MCACVCVCVGVYVCVIDDSILKNDFKMQILKSVQGGTPREHKSWSIRGALMRLHLCMDA